MSGTVVGKHNHEAPQTSNGRGPRVRCDDADSDLLELPSQLTGERCRLIAEIAILDNRSLQAFGATSPARQHVKELLRNSLRSDLECNETRFLSRAAQTFRDRVLSRNRTRYIFGVLLGMLPLAGLAWLASSLSEEAVNHLGLQTALCCSWTILFAGMGALCSVFTRLGRIDMCDETNALFIYLSGVFRPLTATIFALTIIQILKLNMLSTNPPAPAVGSAASVVRLDELHVHLYFLVAFLSGFSERFASDLIGRAERVVGAPVGAASGAGNSEKQMTAGAAGSAVDPA